ncbi:hypothetical protein AB1K09_19950 [Solibacillus silvestris]
MMWQPTPDEIAYYKRVGQGTELDDEYVKDTLPLLLEWAQEQTTVQFKYPNLPVGVKLFLAHALKFFGSAQIGLKSEKMGSVSFSYDFAALPSFVTDFLSEYGYGRKRNRARFHVL